MPVIKGTAFWCKHNTPSDMSGKYEMELGRLTAKQVKELQSYGAPIKKDDAEKDDPNYKGRYIKLISKRKPRAKDAKGNPLPDDLDIGNGSKVKVQFNTYEWSYKKKTGVSWGFQGLQLLELVEYSGGGEDELLDEEDGFVLDDDELEDDDDYDDDLEDDDEIED